MDPDPKEVSLSPRSTRAVATFQRRILGLFPACPEATARAAALRWSRVCPPAKQESEARITHDETIRNVLIEQVRFELAGGKEPDPAQRRRLTERVRAVLAGWK